MAKFLVIFLLSGCSILPKSTLPKTPTIQVGDGGSVSVSGDAKIPAKVDTRKTDSVMAIPEGSRFEFNEKLGLMSLVMAKASQITLNRTETAIEGPIAFDPPKQPTVKEMAEAKAGFWTGLGMKAGLALGVAMALFGLVRGWDFVMYGGASIAAACGFGLFVEAHPILLAVIGLGVSAAIVGPFIYHTKLKHLDSAPKTE